jgi:hypothetical protein
MAKAKAEEFCAPAPLDQGQLLKVWQRARAVPGFSDPFPQNWAYRVSKKKGWVPSLAGVPGVDATRHIRVDANLDRAKVTAKVLADVYGDMARLKPPSAEGSPHLHFYVSCDFDLLGVPNYPDQTREVSFALSAEDGVPWFRFACSTSFSWTTDAHEENRRLFAAERTLREDLIGRVIAAARLPLRIVPAGQSFGVEHVDGVWTGHQEEPEPYGTGHTGCPLPGESPAELVRRALDGLAVMTPVGLPRYTVHLYLEARPKGADPCRDLYRSIQGFRWPVASTSLSTVFRIGSPAGLDGLQPALPGSRAALKLNFARFRPAGQPARGPATTLVVKTQQDGHHLSLLVPPEHADLRAALEDELRVAFKS